MKEFAGRVGNSHEGPFAFSISYMPQPVQSQGFGVSGHCQPNRASLCIYTEIQGLEGRGGSFPVILKQTLMKPGSPATQLPPGPLELVATVKMCSEEDRVSGWPFTMIRLFRYSPAAFSKLVLCGMRK